MLGFGKGKKTLKEQKDFVESLRALAVALERDIAEKRRAGLKMRASRLDGEKIKQEDLVTIEAGAVEAAAELSAVQARLNSARQELDAAIASERQARLQVVQESIAVLEKQRQAALDSAGAGLVEVAKNLILGGLADSFSALPNTGFQNFMATFGEFLRHSAVALDSHLPTGDFVTESKKRAQNDAETKALNSEISRIQRLTEAEIIGG